MQVQVRHGDTLWYYSRIFFIPLQILIDSNQNIHPARLQPGQAVNIPGFVAQDYQIRQGDTFWKLAIDRNISVDTLLLLNQNKNPNLLQIGENVLIPVRVIQSLVQTGVPYDFATLEADLGQLNSPYPFMSVNTIGYSVLGRPLHEIKLGRGAKKVHLNASFHANEWITTPILMALLNTFLLALTNNQDIRGVDVQSLYYSTELSIVPMVDPDGVDLVLHGPPLELRNEIISMNNGSMDFSGWKANIRGVDLNNQYPANWEIEKERKEPKAPAPRDYPGDAPLTEPEAIAMANLARRNAFDRVLALHTQGEEFYWGYEELEPPESEELAREFERVSGYQAVRFIDSHAGFKDWFIQEFRKAGFTIELGEGVNPLPLSQFDEIYEEVLGIFLASLYM